MVSMLTTIDNPWDPFTHYEEWYGWDLSHGYHTPSLLARVVRTSSELSEADQQLAMEVAIDLICEENISGMFKKVTRDTTT